MFPSQLVRKFGEPLLGKRKRNPQLVVPVNRRKTVIRWMIQDEAANGKKNLFSRTVNNVEFKDCFGLNGNANLKKVKSWWNSRSNYPDLYQNNGPHRQKDFLSFTRVVAGSA